MRPAAWTRPGQRWYPPLLHWCSEFVLSGFIQALAISRSERFLLEKLDHKHIQKTKVNDAASLITHFIK